MNQQTAAENVHTTKRWGVVGAGVFGFGFSGLIDVLVLHHVLQWHHLLSGRYPMDTVAGLRTNVLADGLFSLGMLAIIGVGAGLVWRAERQRSRPLAIRPLAGAALVGVGVFDLFDAVVDHMLLGLHQPLSQGGQYNLQWLAVSLLLVAVGYYVYRAGRPSDGDTASGG
ncbi:DUF2243 domain-containing protein [Haloarcula rara]|uniref:DUF2243 domain-containing protein n=1 Tax=Haloarcula rara TaxID=3033387 RepID=UPI0023E81AEE|nr:DUF2243 domain-containing protein [Halomicroarcula sp. SHR3]